MGNWVCVEDWPWYTSKKSPLQTQDQGLEADFSFQIVVLKVPAVSFFVGILGRKNESQVRYASRPTTQPTRAGWWLKERQWLSECVNVLMYCTDVTHVVGLWAWLIQLAMQHLPHGFPPFSTALPLHPVSFPSSTFEAKQSDILTKMEHNLLAHQAGNCKPCSYFYFKEDRVLPAELGSQLGSQLGQRKRWSFLGQKMRERCFNYDLAFDHILPICCQ